MQKFPIRLSFYPDGLDKSEAYLTFETVDDKIEYVKAESKYCLGAYKDYASAWNLDERKQAKIALEESRAKFAKIFFEKERHTSNWKRKLINAISDPEPPPRRNPPRPPSAA